MSTPEFPPDQTTRQVRDAGSPIDIYKEVLTQRYADFTGRSRRAEYWWFLLINSAVYTGIWVVGLILGAASDTLGALVIFLLVIYWLAVLVPSIAVTIRRLHDTSKSGWFLLIGLIPLVGAIILLVAYFTDGDRGQNQYGPSPKYVGEA